MNPFVVLPDRPTLCHFAAARSPLFGRYQGHSPVEDSRHPPFRTIPEHLGLSEEAFAAHLTEEIDAVLLESDEERRREREGDSPPSASTPPLMVPSKWDCVKLLSKCDFSKSGALLGACAGRRTSAGPVLISISIGTRMT